MEVFIAQFLNIMAEFGRKMTQSFQTAIVQINQACEPIRQDLLALDAYLEQRRVT